MSMPLDIRYKDPMLPVEERVKILLMQMTPEEKVAQLTGNGVMAGEFRDIKKEIPNGCGHINGTFLLGETSAEARAKTIEQIQRYMVEETRLGIPALFHMESVSGSFYTDAVVPPVAIAMGATFDPDMARAMAELTGRQNRAEGYNHAFGPVLDIGRDQRWGRLGETYGEDPTLVSKMGSAFVEGLQGNGDLTHHVGATGKHFLGYGMGEDGRNIGNQRIPDRELQEVHLKPWAAAVDAGLSTVMNSYGVINGEPVVTSEYILKTLLREQLNFKGPVVADYRSISRCIEEYDNAEDITDAGIKALYAGLDVELPDPDGFGEKFVQMLKDGEISIQRVDEAVSRVLELKFRLGLFEQPYPDYKEIEALKKKAENDDVPRKLAEESIVLTKNNGILPMKPGTKVAVIGPNGNCKRAFFGGYTYTAMLEMKANMSRMFIGMEGMGGAVTASKEKELLVIDDIEDEISWRYPQAKTMLEAIQGYSSDAVWAKGCDIQGDSEDGFQEALALAREADVVVLALGGRGGWVEGCTSGEGIEVPELGLLGMQEKLALTVMAEGKPTVVAHMDVRPMANALVTEKADAVLECWFGSAWGAEALAGVLFGAVNPSGKLPLTCLKGPEQNPTYIGQLRGCGHVNSATTIQKQAVGGPGGPGAPEGDASPMPQERPDPYAPLYYFGHGLSYTEFNYTDLELSDTRLASEGEIEISLKITNTGSRPGDEVVQLYFHDDQASMVRPVVELAGFQRVSLLPGQTARVTFTFDASQTAFIARDGKWTVEPGGLHLMIGSSCVDIRLKTETEITGAAAKISPHRTYFSPSRVETL